MTEESPKAHVHVNFDSHQQNQQKCNSSGSRGKKRKLDGFQL